MISDVNVGRLIDDLPMILAAITAAIASLVTLRKTTVIGSKQDENTIHLDDVEKKTDIVIGKADKIHELTNSNLSGVTSALAVATEKIQGLEQLIDSMIAASRLAENKVIPGPIGPIGPQGEIGPQGPKGKVIVE